MERIHIFSVIISTLEATSCNYAGTSGLQNVAVPTFDDFQRGSRVQSGW